MQLLDSNSGDGDANDDDEDEDDDIEMMMVMIMMILMKTVMMMMKKQLLMMMHTLRFMTVYKCSGQMLMMVRKFIMMIQRNVMLYSQLQHLNLVYDVCMKDKNNNIGKSFTKGESMKIFSNSRASNKQPNSNERESRQTFKEFIHISFSRS